MTGKSKKIWNKLFQIMNCKRRICVRLGNKVHFMFGSHHLDLVHNENWKKENKNSVNWLWKWKISIWYGTVVWTLLRLEIGWVNWFGPISCFQLAAQTPNWQREKDAINWTNVRMSTRQFTPNKKEPIQSISKWIGNRSIPPYWALNAGWKRTN